MELYKFIFYPFFCNPLHDNNLLFNMSTEGEKAAPQENVADSQFQKPGDLVERNEDTGVMSMESLCMNCHENVSVLADIIEINKTRRKLTNPAGRN